MNADERKHFIELVLDKVAQVTETIAEFEELTRPIAPDDSIGRISRMDAINNKSVNDAALRKAKTRLAGLQRILERKDHDDLGICDRCKQEIPMGRLLLVPESTKCVNCAAG
jgi:DnaK suppressor protein